MASLTLPGLGGCIGTRGAGPSRQPAATPPAAGSPIGDLPTTAPTTTTAAEPESGLQLHTRYNSRRRYESPGTRLHEAADPSAWSAVTGSMTTDDTTSFVGSTCVKVVGKNARDAAIECRFESPVDLSNTDLSLSIKTTTPDYVAVSVYLFDPDGHYEVRALRGMSYKAPDVDWFRTCPGVFKVSEPPPDLATVERVRIQPINAGRGDIDLWIDDLRTHPRPEKGYVVLTWDDGNRVYIEEAAPLHDQHDVPGVLGIIPSLTKEEGFMSAAELTERQAAGDEIVTHGSIHKRFHELAPSELAAVIRQNKQWLLDHEFEGAKFVIYPGNAFDATALNVVSRYHYAGGFNQAFGVNNTGIYGFDPLAIPRTVGDDLERTKRAVDLAAAHCNCAILNFHHFEHDNTISRSAYASLLDHIERKDDAIEVITLGDLWAMRTAAR